MDVKLQKTVKLRTQSRDIVQEILNFGVTDEQKIDIIYFLSMELEDNNLMKNIAEVLKKNRTKFNDSEDDNNISNEPSKKIII